MLPKIDAPVFELELPSTGEKVKYRPFTVKEEKVLLIAKDSDDPKHALEACKQIINNCLVRGPDVEKMPLFDLEYVFLMIRTKSVGNVVDMRIRHDDGQLCDVKVDLNKVKVVKSDKHQRTIKLTDKIGVKMKYPSVDTLEHAADDPHGVLAACIETIYENDEVFSTADHSKEEVLEFVSGLGMDHMKKIREFFETLPRIELEVEYALKGGAKAKKTLRGLGDFLASA